MDRKITPVLFVMGVSGIGKTTISKLLAERLGLPFFDGDDYHPVTNVEKMANGHPLNDKDRIGWLKTLNRLAYDHIGNGAVIACSSLKEKYRILLKNDIAKHISFIYLEGSFEEVLKRMQKREGHFMPIDLLKSQFDALEPPKDAVAVAINQTPEEIVTEIMRRLVKK